MKSFLLLLFIFIFNFLLFSNKTNAESLLDDYINDFYLKTSQASKILEEIEIKLKEGSKVDVCSKQRQAARIGLSANESLIKAFELQNSEPPILSISASNLRWESILNECKNY
tara:strand:- start:133 stop:471 length:339 start_codon:yes stop_codon:yes gene_type:complete